MTAAAVLAWVRAHWRTVSVVAAVLLCVGLASHLLSRPQVTKTEDESLQVNRDSTTKRVVLPSVRTRRVTRTVMAPAVPGQPCQVASVTVTEDTTKTGGSETVTKIDDREQLRNKETTVSSPQPRWLVAGSYATDGAVGAEVLYRLLGPVWVGARVEGGPRVGVRGAVVVGGTF